VVVSSGKTTFDMLQRAIDSITRTTGRVLGVVLNKVPRKGAESAYYGREYYGAYERYGQEPDKETPATADTQPGVRRRGTQA
jgi:Mrp family chromosome partitioning ATPase